MLTPDMATWVKEESRFTRLWVSRSDVRTFIEVAPQATKGQIAFYCLPTVRLRDDMLNVVGDISVVLTDATILTATAGSLDY